MSDNLYEKEGTEFEMECFICTGGTGLPYSISRVSVEPAFDSCSKCFDVYAGINGKTAGTYVRVHGTNGPYV